jgi:hypothetical protein
MEVALEMTPHHTITERSRYTITSAFGEIGGVQSLVAMVLAALVQVRNFNSVSNFLVSNMFRVEKVDQKVSLTSMIRRQRTALTNTERARADWK